MRSDDWAGFFFAGAAIVPALLGFAGEAGGAALTLVALMCAGCLAALADPKAPFRT